MKPPMSKRTPNNYEFVKSPLNAKDITVGYGTVPWGWSTDGRSGWRLPGGKVTDCQRTARWAAWLIDQEIARAMR